MSSVSTKTMFGGFAPSAPATTEFVCAYPAELPAPVSIAPAAKTPNVSHECCTTVREFNLIVATRICRPDEIWKSFYPSTRAVAKRRLTALLCSVESSAHTVAPASWSAAVPCRFPEYYRQPICARMEGKRPWLKLTSLHPVQRPSDDGSVAVCSFL